MLDPGCVLNLTACPIASLSKGVIVWVAIISFTGFAAMGYDKSMAVSGGWRVREMTLWTLAFMGGAWGVIAGEVVFHHKSRKLAFTVVVLAAAVVWLEIFVRLGLLPSQTA